MQHVSEIIEFLNLSDPFHKKLCLKGLYNKGIGTMLQCKFYIVFLRQCREHNYP